MTTPSLKIAIIAGGPAAENAVSRTSAAGVAKAARATWPDVTLLELDSDLPARLINEHFDVAFPVLHGPVGEDGTLQGFLEIVGLPYVGSGVLASACGMNKVVAKQIFRAFGLPVAREMIIEAGEAIDSAVARIADSLPLDVVIKPVGQGSGLGVAFARSREELAAGLRTAQQFHERVLIEERIEGKEITCGVLDDPEPRALMTIEVRTPEGTWYDYQHRYTQGLSEHIIPAEIGEDRNRRVMEIAVLAHRALGCRDLSRVDFVVPESGEPILLEVNTLPGMTPTSLFPDGARASGYTFEDVIRLLILRAWERRETMPLRKPAG